MRRGAGCPNRESPWICSDGHLVTTTEKHHVISPHGIPLTHEPFQSKALAEEFIPKFCVQMRRQGYYPSVGETINGRVFDAIKLKVAAYYYNRAAGWHKEVSLSTKDHAYLAGSILDFERSSRAPKELTDYPWQVDEPVLYRFGYTEGSPIADAAHLVRLLVDCTSKNGGLLLNISPKADGPIPDDQQKLLLQIGAWLDINGLAIYGTRPWTKFSEGKIRFTTRRDALYAISQDWAAKQVDIIALARGSVAGLVDKITLLGHPGSLPFTQDETGLHITLPPEKPGDYAFSLEITGLQL